MSKLSFTLLTVVAALAGIGCSPRVAGNDARKLSVCANEKPVGVWRSSERRTIDGTPASASVCMA